MLSPGRKFWTFTYEVPPESNAYLMVVKGLAISGNTLFWLTERWRLDRHLWKSGRAIWNKTMLDWRDGLQYNVAPLIIKNMGAPCTAYNVCPYSFVAAYDVKTGNVLWRFWTTPNAASDPGANTWGGDSYKHGGDPIWVTGSSDPQTNLTYWGTGDPNPGWGGDSASRR